MPIQKVIKVGNSYAVTIPKEFVKELDLKAGQKVSVITNDLLESVTIQPLNAKVPLQGITPEFVEWLKQFQDRYKEALSELAKR